MGSWGLLRCRWGVVGGFVRFVGAIIICVVECGNLAKQQAQNELVKQ